MLGRIIRDERVEKALTREELAQKAGISASALVRIELGMVHPRPKTLRGLADALGLPVETLARQAKTPTESQSRVPSHERPAPVMDELQALNAELPSFLDFQVEGALQRIAARIIASVISSVSTTRELEELGRIIEAARQVDGQLRRYSHAVEAYVAALRDVIDATPPGSLRQSLAPSPAIDRIEELLRAIDTDQEDASFQHAYREACREFARLLVHGHPREFQEAVHILLLKDAQLAAEDLGLPERSGRLEPSRQQAFSALAALLSAFSTANALRTQPVLAAGDRLGQVAQPA